MSTNSYNSLQVDKILSPVCSCICAAFMSVLQAAGIERLTVAKPKHSQRISVSELPACLL